MTRLPSLTRDELNPDQLNLYDMLASAGLVDQFASYLRSPELGLQLMSVGGFFRKGADVDRRLVELAICIVTAHYRAEFAFSRHRPMAIQDGIAPEVIEDLRLGRIPQFAREDEQVVYAVTSQLLLGQQVGDDTYTAATAVLGERGLFELISAVGFYVLMAMILNLYEVEAPEVVFPEHVSPSN